ncbi:MAG: Gfo/Idh/MocA family protein [Streptosporangiales bacterium]
MAEPLSIAIVGAGNRGSGYARIAATDGRASVVAVAEPDEKRRDSLARDHGIPADRCFKIWQELACEPRLADAVIVATQDAMHYSSVIAMIQQGYHVLLEKPMAATEEECDAIVDEAERAGVILALCHVLRYTPYTQALRRTIDSGVIGDVVSVQHLEPVGWWHQAHSFVRGNWRRTDESAFMLLAKSVHDLDWLNHIIALRPQRVSSFGGLYHFRPEQAPEGAASRCLDCPVEQTCPYSAVRIYMSCLGDPQAERWPLSTVTSDLTPQGVLTALRDGPYGRCVYDCDNDVVDHQVVNIEYERGVNASFTMTAFTPHTFRLTRVFGTHGYLTGDGDRISVLDFRTSEEHTIDLPVGANSGAGGHAGGDSGLIRAFISGLTSGSPQSDLTDPRDSLASHKLAWAAERARLTSSVIDLPSTRKAPHDSEELPCHTTHTA